MSETAETSVISKYIICVRIILKSWKQSSFFSPSNVKMECLYFKRYKFVFRMQGATYPQKSNLHINQESRKHKEKKYISQDIVLIKGYTIQYNVFWTALIVHFINRDFRNGSSGTGTSIRLLYLVTLNLYAPCATVVTHQ